MSGGALELRGAGALEVGDVPGGEQLVKSLRLVGTARNADASLSLSGAHCTGCRAVVAGSTFTGAGPHAFRTGRGVTRIGLWFEAPDEEGPLDCTVTLSVGGESASAAFVGDVVLFSLETELDLGRVDLGDSRQGSITLRNRSRRAADFTITAPSAPFSAVMTDVSLGPMGSTPIPVELEPAEAGPCEASLVVTRSSAGGSVERTAKLAGEGVEPVVIDRGSPTQVTSPVEGDFQRLYVRVPTYETIASLGKELDRTDLPPTHAGFSARTSKHILFRSRGDERSTTFQAHDQVWFQSTTDAVQFGAGDSGLNIISGDATYLSANTGIVLAAGHGDIDAMEDLESFGHGVLPPSPGFGEVSDALDNVKLGWSIGNLAMAAVGLAYTGMRLKVKIKNTTKNKKWKDMVDPANGFMTVPIAGAIKTATMTGLTIRDMVHGASRKKQDKPPEPWLPAGSVNAISEGGILGGTFSYCSMYGGTGATFRSVNAAVLGLVNASIDSLMASGMFGFNSAGLTSVATCAVSSGLRTMIGAGAGTLDVKGPSIAATGMKALVQGGGGVNFAAPTMSTKVAAAMTARAGSFVASSLATTMISVGGLYGVLITPLGIEIGSTVGPLIDKTKPRMTIDDTGISLSYGPEYTSCELLIKTYGVSLWGPGMATSANVTDLGPVVTAMRVELA